MTGTMARCEVRLLLLAAGREVPSELGFPLCDACSTTTMLDSTVGEHGPIDIGKKVSVRFLDAGAGVAAPVVLAWLANSVAMPSKRW